MNCVATLRHCFQLPLEAKKGLPLLNGRPFSVLKEIQNILKYYFAVGFVKKFMAFVFVQLGFQIPVSHSLEERKKLFKLLFGNNDRIILSCHNEERKLWIIRMPVIRTECFFLQRKQIDEAVRCKNKSAKWIAVVCLYIIGIFRKPCIGFGIAPVKAFECHAAFSDI